MLFYIQKIEAEQILWHLQSNLGAKLIKIDAKLKIKTAQIDLHQLEEESFILCSTH